MNLHQIHSILRRKSDSKSAIMSARYFKTGKGEYGEGDQFLGISVPEVRKFAKEFRELALPETLKLLKSPYNEERLLALFIMANQYKTGDEKSQARIFQIFLKNRKFVNNWNLVDSSAHLIVGEHLYKKDRKILQQLARSKSLWDRRIAIISTMAFIRKNDYKSTLKISTILLNDEQDLIHKACGWMLREVGKRNLSVLEVFLNGNCRKMPRTMLRYSLERMPLTKRKYYMNKK